jgi:hypothetical protein
MTFGGYTDWFLPSSGELNTLFFTNLYKSSIGGFAANGYWSSSEYSATLALAETVVSGNQGNGYKTSNGYVRCARRY